MAENALKQIAVFLDRDGTIIENVPYLSNPEKIFFLNRSIDAIKIFNQLGIKTFIVTNQSGIARGFLSEEILDLIHKKMIDTLKNNNASIDEFFYCPHLPDGIVKEYSIDCDCRKPKNGLILKAKNKHNIDLKNSFFIGDSISDMQVGRNSNLATIAVNDGLTILDKTLCDYIVSDLYEAAQIITKKIKEFHAI